MTGNCGERCLWGVGVCHYVISQEASELLQVCAMAPGTLDEVGILCPVRCTTWVIFMYLKVFG